jgi:hypothetical protein
LAPIDLFAVIAEVRPLLGFFWGFNIDSQSALTVQPGQILAGSDWQRHVAYLADRFPRWKFEPMARA